MTIKKGATQTHQPKLHMGIAHFTAFGYCASPNTGGQKQSRDLSLALRGRFVNTPTQHGASLPSLWQPICFQLCLKPHSGQDYALTRQLHLLGSSSVFQNLRRLETAAGQSPLLPKQGQGDIPPWEESSKHLCSPWPDGARPHASTKPEHLYQSGIYIIRNHLGFILSERQFSSPDLLLKLRLAGLEGTLHAALKY